MPIEAGNGEVALEVVRPCTRGVSWLMNVDFWIINT